MGIDIISVFNPPEETISVKECRELRACIHDFTNGCMLTKKEYMAIMVVLLGAAERMEKAGQVAPKN